jgi:CspA family cold shock protein
MEMVLKEVSNLQQSLTGRVKWFDHEKGLGFVLVDGFEGEFLLHRNVLRSCRRDSIAEHSSVEFQPEFTPKGNRVAEIFFVTPPNVSDHKDSMPAQRTVNSPMLPARVKWFDASKGYGFVNSYGFEEDIFIGVEALTRSGLNSLKSGEAVCIQVEEHKGRGRVYQIHEWPSNKI